VTPSKIDDLDSLKAALAAARFLLFKHSHRCGTSDRAFRQYTKFLAEQEELPTGWINVVEQRDWSDRVARMTGVAHESPQVLWIRDGEVVWHASHWEITVDALDKAVRS
jgi:bacillithiol system protein YtxJ